MSEDMQSSAPTAATTTTTETVEAVKTIRALWEAQNLCWRRYLRAGRADAADKESTYNAATAALRAETQRLRAAAPFATQVRGAYHPRDCGNSAGSGHVIVAEVRGLRAGRLIREERDALCKPARSFWGLSADRGADEPDCIRCLEILERLVAAPEKVTPIDATLKFQKSADKA